MTHRAGAVASRAIELAVRGESFQVKDIQHGVSDPPSRQTCYRVLRQLEADGWIQCVGKHWRPDLKAEMLGDVDQDDRDRQAGMSFDAEELLGE